MKLSRTSLAACTDLAPHKVASTIIPSIPNMDENSLVLQKRGSPVLSKIHWYYERIILFDNIVFILECTRTF